MSVQRIYLLAFVLFFGASACARSEKNSMYRDFRKAGTISMTFSAGEEELEVHLYRDDKSEKSYRAGEHFMIVQGGGTYQKGESDIWIDFELYLPKKEYKEGEVIQLNLVKRPSNYKIIKPYIQYREWKIEKSNTKLFFSTEKVIGTPTTSPKFKIGTAKGTVTITSVSDAETFEADFELELIAPGDGADKRNFRDGVLFYSKIDEEKL